MAVDPISSTSAAARASQTTMSAAGTAQKSLNADYQSFLKLLTAQISNQDPLEPMDSTTFVSQLAQLSQVEQAITTNSNLEAISQNLAAMSGLTEAAMIGREVRVPSSDFAVGPDGPAGLSYELESTASSVTAVISHPSGGDLRRIEGLPATAGTRHEIDWDGIAMDGLPVAQGQYQVRLEAEGPEGETVAHETFTTGTVESVLFAGGETRLSLSNGSDVASAEVVELR
ncbi:flagellar hook capping protein FlgD [Roseivivax marinus]|uniref:Basal-body rod modification protein FlgD n=1 Tax=Roseivivax marinus TaxID=1379903 RepID=W4HFE5_9RHOB|nr:flagellar hook capping FlgD N-terminal domain-containing protein [Roseivivax marinus]ETW11477.1 flagellar hook capping protein FlgD [Roseivivax marinus]